MREPPVDLSDDTLAANLRTHYGLAVTSVTFLPLGHDSSAWVYRVQADDEASYFLKVRTSVTNAPSLLVPRYLQEHGVAHVLAPLPTTGALWAEVAGYALILYSFIAGTAGMAQGMTEAQWIAYGAILRQIHSMAITPELAHSMRQETFVPAGGTMVRDVDGHIGRRPCADPVGQHLAALWHERRDVIRTLVARAEELGRQVARKAPPFVLCHADIHTDNVLLDAEDQIWIVDWDENETCRAVGLRVLPGDRQSPVLTDVKSQALPNLVENRGITQAAKKARTGPPVAREYAGDTTPRSAQTAEGPGADTERRPRRPGRRWRR